MLQFPLKFSHIVKKALKVCANMDGILEIVSYALLHLKMIMTVQINIIEFRLY